MTVEVVGGENPEYAVVACIHGKEVCGYEAIQRLKDNYEFEKPLKIIIANEKARKQDVRYTEKDLNRCFPGGSESDVYEERLAAKILEEVEGLTVIDLHSTYSKPTPFAFIMEEDSTELVESSGVEKAVVLSTMDNILISHTKGISIECGYTGDEEAAENAYSILVNFLAAEGIIDADFEKSEPQLYEVYDEVYGEDYLFTKKNFEKIEEGEVFAFRERDGDQIVAEEDFIPILMSDNGYPHKIGYKGRKFN